MNKKTINSAELIASIKSAVIDENTIVDAISAFYDRLCAERFRAKEEELAQTADTMSKLNDVTNVILTSDYVQNLSDDNINMVRKKLGFDLARLLCVDAERRDLLETFSDDEAAMYKHVTLKLPVIQWMEAFELTNGIATLTNGITDDLVVDRERFESIFHQDMTFAIPMSKIREVADEITEEIHLYEGEAYEAKVMRLVKLDKQRADLIHAFVDYVDGYSNSTNFANCSYERDIATYEDAKRLGIRKARTACGKYNRLANILSGKTALTDLSTFAYFALLEFAYWCDEVKCYDINILPFANCAEVVSAASRAEECAKRRAPHTIDFWLQKFSIDSKDVILFDSLVGGKNFNAYEAAKLICNEAIFPDLTIKEICNVHRGIAEYLCACDYTHDEMIECGLILDNDDNDAEDDYDEEDYFR